MLVLTFERGAAVNSGVSVFSVDAGSAPPSASWQEGPLLTFLLAPRGICNTKPQNPARLLSSRISKRARPAASVKSAIAGDDGTYRFVQLSLNTDYEIWAQSGDHKSPTRSISSFDSKADITVFLKIDN